MKPKFFHNISSIIIIPICCLIIASCSKNSGNISEKLEENMIIDDMLETVENINYIQISQDEAKRIMDEETNYVILDVREQDEYDEKHIPNAILIPYTEIENSAKYILKDKDQLILVYCRSGRRSKIAAESLVSLGYTNVYEFGGIIDWQYETE